MFKQIIILEGIEKWIYSIPFFDMYFLSYLPFIGLLRDTIGAGNFVVDVDNILGSPLSKSLREIRIESKRRGKKALA